MTYTVYTITNTTNGKVYVGATSERPDIRWRRHRTALLANNYANAPLYEDWLKLGMDAFEFRVIETLGEDVKNLTEANVHQDAWIDTFPEVYNVQGTPAHAEITRKANTVRAIRKFFTKFQSEYYEQLRQALEHGKTKGSWGPTARLFKVNLDHLKQLECWGYAYPKNT